MEQELVERRRGRRVHLEGPLRVRATGTQGPGSFAEHTTNNVSLAGVYFELEGVSPFAVDDIVIVSVSVPESSRREFPFTRLAGPGRVVRVTELSPPEGGGARKRFGVALEFSEELTALTAIPSRG